MKSKGEKYVIKMLRSRTANSAKHIASQKEVYFDTLEEVQKIMIRQVETYESQSLEVLKEQMAGLKNKNNKVDDVLRDVIKVTEFNED